MRGVPVALIIIGAWVLVGLLTAVWLARRGHRDPAWLVLAVVLGPILAVTAKERVQQEPRVVARMEAGDRRNGHLRVLVGVDGSAEAQAALRVAIDLLGPSVKELVVVEVVDYDAAETDLRGRVAAAKERLTAAAEATEGRAVTCEVLAGPPAATLARYAREHDIDVLVVGRHGRGVSKRLLGNVAQELIREAELPVLVAGGYRAAGAGPGERTQ